MAPKITKTAGKDLQHEEEHQGSIWKHPYMIYVVLTMFLFLFLVLMGWLAWTQGWIPNRGVSGA